MVLSDRCRFVLDERLTEAAWLDGLRGDVLRGLTARPKTLPPKYFYDGAGGELFEKICLQKEYYLPSAEREILESHAPGLLRAMKPDMLVELGSGGSTKTEILLRSLPPGRTVTYVPIDVDRAMILAAGRRIAARFPRVRVVGVVDDFTLRARLPKGRKRLILFLGSSLGNWDFPEAAAFLGSIGGQMTSTDRLLLGIDLVKSKKVLEAAYNDRAGVTAAFNRNVLRVINHRLGGSFHPERFAHRAFYDARKERIEMHLVSAMPQRILIRDLGIRVSFSRGETIQTEISCKYTREGIRDVLARAGLREMAWFQDSEARFALSLSRTSSCGRAAPRVYRPVGP